MVCFRLSQQSMNSQSSWKNRFLPFFAHFQLKLPSVRIGFCRDAEIFRSTIPPCCLACRCLRTPCAAMWHGTADFWCAVSSSTPCMLHVPFQNLHTCSQLIFIFKTIRVCVLLLYVQYNVYILYHSSFNDFYHWYPSQKIYGAFLSHRPTLPKKSNIHF